ncbi:hypothetical protein GT360_18230 [Vibrio astriarenae]|uniref:Porin n=1 Tax=Vibrio astriarenae TaxID=1481923 RepID=A0A7Z2YFG1_9VIBR|nr:oligogalacturonate-specific porin KdgM family protein [Vibrio astriarenae]QIA65477.1 hypothetical protein GT360_18230 [Vibrio astriarenae]
MKKANLLTLAVASAVLSTSVSATTLMVRQEYLPKAEQFNPNNTNATLVKLSGSTGKTFMGLQAVHKGEKLDRYALSSTEAQLGYRYDLNDTIRLTPQLQATATGSGIGWKPMFAMTYKLGAGFSTTLLYKHEFFVRQEDNSNGSTTEKSQYQASINYADGPLRLGVKYDYHKGLDGQRYYNGKEFKQELEFSTYYRVARGLTPFVNLAAVPVHWKSDEYQLRTRVGVLYSF